MLRGPQPTQPLVFENGAVGQHRRRTILQGQLEDSRHVAVEERLAASEVILLDAERHRLVKGAADGFKVEEAEAAVVWPAAYEAVRALEIAQGAADLEPEVVEMRQ